MTSLRIKKQPQVSELEFVEVLIWLPNFFDIKGKL